MFASLETTVELVQKLTAVQGFKFQVLVLHQKMLNELISTYSNMLGQV